MEQFKINYLENTQADAYWFATKIINGKPRKYVLQENSFECGAFMANETIPSGEFENHEKYRRYLLIAHANNENDILQLNSDVINWWYDIVNKSIGSKLEYAGVEPKRPKVQYFKYPLGYSIKGGQNLYRFTLSRYVWASPFKGLIHRMYNVDPSITEKHGFWRVFLLLHGQLAFSNKYDPTFGFTRSNKVYTCPKSDKYNLLSEAYKELETEMSAYIGINDSFNAILNHIHYNDTGLSSKDFHDKIYYFTDDEIDGILTKEYEKKK